MDKLSVAFSGLVIVLVGGFLLLFTSCSRVPTGHVGILSNFGKIEGDSLGEGLRFALPWKTIHHVNIQVKEDKEEASAPTKEGLSVQLEASLLYSLSKDKAPEVFRTVGANYETVIVNPQFRAAIRSATTHYEAKDLYTANREQIEAALLKDIKSQLEPKGVIVSQVLLRDVKLPPVVKDRIEAKLAAEQDAQRMQFIIQKETQEAERKRVEAKGIADSQKIIQTDLSHSYLIYLWIEALKEGARHNNSVIYVPTGSDGMPLFKEIKDPPAPNKGK